MNIGSYSIEQTRGAKLYWALSLVLHVVVMTGGIATAAVLLAVLWERGAMVSTVLLFACCVVPMYLPIRMGFIGACSIFNEAREVSLSSEGIAVRTWRSEKVRRASTIAWDPIGVAVSRIGVSDGIVKYGRLALDGRCYYVPLWVLDKQTIQ
jgi:hypothetical protein